MAPKGTRLFRATISALTFSALTFSALTFSAPTFSAPIFGAFYYFLLTLTQSPNPNRNPKQVNCQIEPNWRRNDPCRKRPATK